MIAIESRKQSIASLDYEQEMLPEWRICLASLLDHNFSLVIDSRRFWTMHVNHDSIFIKEELGADHFQHDNAA